MHSCIERGGELLLQSEGKVYCTMLDASKAFDGVKYSKLFDILLQRELPAPLLRLLLNQYSRQLVRTFWKGETSNVFQTVNGVRQGGVLSPVLFTLYIDILLHRLEDSGFGCTVGQEYFGILCYADDITLLSPTLYGLQKMLAICEQFSYEYNINYNPKKTVCLCFSGKQLPQDADCATLYGNQYHGAHLPNTWAI